MSEALDQETQNFSRNMDKLLDDVCQVAEATRIFGKEQPLFRGGEIARHSAGHLVVAGRELKPDYFLVLFYDEAEVLNPDPFSRLSLEDCLAWILKYDSHYSRWSVEAWNIEKGNRSFSKLARSLNTLPRPGSTALVVS
ncbi:unnamed protein product [marine sediment metagenome]|uniref:Uncharacterized protein n=1 Tax=marine sediment metagenome TaxID=412755 RepID=X1S3J8_9ZZZZ